MISPRHEIQYYSCYVLKTLAVKSSLDFDELICTIVCLYEILMQLASIDYIRRIDFGVCRLVC